MKATTSAIRLGHCAEDQRQVEGHADAEEEEPEEETAEGLDIRLELVAEARFGEEDAGEEGAHCHREAARLHREGRPEDDEQRRRRHHLARLGVGEDAEYRVEEVAPDRNHAGDGAERRGRS